jgi:IS30 family transposase
MQEIASRLKKNRLSIYRELERNSGPLGYFKIEAQQRAEVRCQRPRRPANLNDPWSGSMSSAACSRPDQIAGRSRRDFPRDGQRQLSRQTIYA